MWTQLNAVSLRCTGFNAASSLVPTLSWSTDIPSDLATLAERLGFKEKLDPCGVKPLISLCRNLI